MTHFFVKEPCVKMFLWKRHIFVLYPHKVVIWSDDTPNDQLEYDFLGHVGCTQIYFFDWGAYVDAFIVKGDNQAKDTWSEDRILENVLRLILRDGQGYVSSYEIRYEQAPDGLNQFSFRRVGFLQISDTCNSVFEARILCLGTSTRRIVVNVLDQQAWHKSLLYTAPIIEQDGSFGFGTPVLLDMSGMPLLFEMTSMDFDDDMGILVFGMRSGEVIVRTFGNRVPARCLKNDLPTLDTRSDFKVSMYILIPVLY